VAFALITIVLTATSKYNLIVKEGHTYTKKGHTKTKKKFRLVNSLDMFVVSNLSTLTTLDWLVQCALSAAEIALGSGPLHGCISFFSNRLLQFA
jgi:hypothetical protein